MSSITLPYDPNVEILAMDLVPAASATPVSLSSSYNRIGIFADGASYPGNGGLDGYGYAYSGAQLTSPVSWDGQQFALGPVGSNDAVSAVGQTIALPSGSDSQLLLLGTGVNGNQAGLTFTVTYSDGSTGTFTQSFSDWHTPQGYGGESAATSSMSYRDTNSGGEQSALFDLYAYAAALNASKTVSSITLPYDPNVEILAMDLVPAASATPVSLSSSYNRIGIFADGASYPGNGGLDGYGYAYSGAQLTSPVSWDGQQFALGPVGGNDAVSAVGQTIALPSGSYSQLLLLGTGVNGNQAGLTFTVTYSDGSTGTFTQSFSDWHTPQGYGGESAATSSMSYRDTNSGGEQSALFELYGYAATLNASKTVSSITLPDDPNVEILAMDLVGQGAVASPPVAAGHSGSSVASVTSGTSAPAIAGIGSRSFPKGPIAIAGGASAATTPPIVLGVIPPLTDPTQPGGNTRKSN